MSLTFEQVMQLTRTISSSAAFEEPECRAYFDILMGMPSDSKYPVVEIGLQFGRSSSIALSVAKERKLRYVGIDPFIDPPEAIDAWTSLARKIGHPFTLCCEDSKNSFVPMPGCVLIDGNHWEEYVRSDTQRFASCVQVGGYALYHDVGDFQLPNVYPTVDAKLVRSLIADLPGKWEELPRVGCLGIFQRTA